MSGDLTIVDLADSADDIAVAQLLALHRVWFDDHPHVQPELAENARLPRHRGHLVVHQFLARVDGVPAGFAVVHTSLRRRVGLIHFLAVEEPFRRYDVAGTHLPHHLVEVACAQVQADGRAYGSPAEHGTVAESADDLVATWQRFGFEPLPTDYAEPYHGMHWERHGPADFFEMTLMGHGMTHGPTAAAEAAAQAFLLDHYRLPPTHPRVLRALASG